jgi:hypothetical protein
MPEVLGVDFGRVICDIDHDNAKPPFDDERYLEVPAVEGAFEALRRLVAERFAEEVMIISQCISEEEILVRNWLSRHKFHEECAVLKQNIYFCGNAEGKAAYCRRYGINHFIDDRLEVLKHLVGHVPNLYLFQPKFDEMEEFIHYLPRVVRVESWQEVLALLLPPLEVD